MRANYTEDGDGLYIRLDDSPIVDSQEVHPGVVLDFDAQRKVVGLEVLGLRARLPNADLSVIDFTVTRKVP